MKDYQKIKHYFQNNTITKTIVLDGCQTIQDVNKTANSLIELIDKRLEEKGYEAYYRTLKRIYKQLIK